MLGGVAHQSKDGLDGSAEVFLYGDLAQTFGIASCLTILVIDIDEIDVARDIEFSRTQLAHAHHPKLGFLAVGQHGRAMPCIKVMKCLLAGLIQRQLCQMRDRGGDEV